MTELPDTTLTARELAERWPTLPHLGAEEAGTFAEDLADSRERGGATLVQSNRGPRANFAVCVDAGVYAASLERWKVYGMLPDETARAHDQIRVVDESGEDYLYPARCFQPIRLPAALEALYGTGTPHR